MYDLDEIKTLPCSEVANSYGIVLKKKGNRLWGRLRDTDKTSSFSININLNLWYDFGSCKGGSVIDLVSEIEQISSKEAINLIADVYGFKNVATIGWQPLTDKQYGLLGIQAEKATMNFTFDLCKHTEKQLHTWANKYNMDMRGLADKYPIIYNQTVNSVAMKLISGLREMYQTRLNMYLDPLQSTKSKEVLWSFLRTDAEEHNYKLELLKRAIKPLYKGQRINLSYLFLNPEKDIKNPFLQKIKKLENSQVFDNMVRIYKQLYNYNQIDDFTIEQIEALSFLNNSLGAKNNKYISIEDIKLVHSKLGARIEELANNRNKMLDEGFIVGGSEIKEADCEIDKKKFLFSQSCLVIEGINNSASYANS